MEELTNISYIRSLLEKHGFSFSKQLGQNFLINPVVCPKMAEMSGTGKDVCALEIGPGFGVLTAELAKRSKKVVAIELDDRIPAVLADTLKDFDNVKVISGDALKLDLNRIIEDEFGDNDTVICANLPYYITSPVIMKLLEEKVRAKNITVMVQKEAGVRICAKPGTRDIGAISLAVRYYAQPEMLFNVSRGSFMPAPNVDSCVISLKLRDKPPFELKDEATYFEVIRAAFSQRRKTLRNSLSAGLSMDKELVDRLTEMSGLGPNARPEELLPEQFKTLSDNLFVLRMENKAAD